jgi:hypothetical protein
MPYIAVVSIIKVEGEIYDRMSLKKNLHVQYSIIKFPHCGLYYALLLCGACNNNQGCVNFEMLNSK